MPKVYGTHLFTTCYPLNCWTDGWRTIEARRQPPDSPHGPFWPVVSLRRVNGASYRPYVRGSHDWRYRANQRLARAAYANLERRSSMSVNGRKHAT
jgi:hypothetical protein